MIRNIVTDFYVLKHFSHFYLPHYITASDRCLTTSNTVQLQSLKFKKQPEMNNEQLMKLKEILLEVFPDIPKELLYIDSTELKDYLYQLYIIYVKSFCNDDTNLSSFPEDDDVLSQFKWLRKTVKRQR